MAAMNGLIAGLHAFVGKAAPFSASIDTLQKALAAFATKSDALVTALKGLNNLKISLDGRQTVEVIVNGAEVLTKIMPEIKDMIDQKTADAIRGFVWKSLPEAEVPY
jgi:ABC-type transporter Mla subunit MlaD